MAKQNNHQDVVENIVIGNDNSTNNNCQQNMTVDLLKLLENKDSQISKVIALIEKKDEQIDRLLSIIESFKNNIL